jgi:hypothetical protein
MEEESHKISGKQQTQSRKEDKVSLTQKKSQATDLESGSLVQCKEATELKPFGFAHPLQMSLVWQQ